MAREIVVYQQLPNGEYTEKETLVEEPLPPWCVPPLLEHAEEIDRTLKYFWARLEGAHVGADFAGGCDLVLGVLLTLWAGNKFVQPCGKCGETAYVVRAIGMPLSGSNTWWGVCPRCDREVSGHAPLWREFSSPALSMGRMHQNPIRIDPGERARYTWDDRIIGRNTPDRVVGFRHDWLPLSVILHQLLGEDSRYAGRLVENRG